MVRILVCLSILLALLAADLQAQTEEGNSLTARLAPVSGASMVKDVARLSGPDFNGRQVGTADELRSGLSVTNWFNSLGLATVVSGGPHADFHQRGDPADKIKLEILEGTARFVLALAGQLANAP